MNRLCITYSGLAGGPSWAGDRTQQAAARFGLAASTLIARYCMYIETSSSFGSIYPHTQVSYLVALSMLKQCFICIYVCTRRFGKRGGYCSNEVSVWVRF